MAGSSAPGFAAVSDRGGRFIRYDVFDQGFVIPSEYFPMISFVVSGYYGFVCSVKTSGSGEIVAIKKIVDAFSNSCNAKMAQREIKILKFLDHGNETRKKAVIPPPVREAFNDVYIVTEPLQADLRRVMFKTELTEKQCQTLI